MTNDKLKCGFNHAECLTNQCVFFQIQAETDKTHDIQKPNETQQKPDAHFEINGVKGYCLCRAFLHNVTLMTAILPNQLSSLGGLAKGFGGLLGGGRGRGR